MIQQSGVKTVTTSSATWRVETLPDGSMGNVELVECKLVRLPRNVTIEDSLIVRDPSVAMGGYEFKGQLIEFGKGARSEILFSIVSKENSVDDAIAVARQSPVVKALITADWFLRDVWRVQPDEF
jgi:hypothetical protein